MESIRATLASIKRAAETGNLAEARRLAAQLCTEAPDEGRGWLWRVWLAESVEEALHFARLAVRVAPGPATEQALRWAEARSRPLAEPEAPAVPGPLAPPAPRRRAGRHAALLEGIFLLAALLALAVGQKRALLAPPIADLHATPPAGLAALPAPTIVAASTVPSATPLPLPTETATPLPTPVDVPLHLAQATEGSTPPAPDGLPPVARVAAENELRLGANAERALTAPPVLATPVPTVASAPPDSPYALWPARNHPVIYRVKAGETLTTIAAQLGLQPTTLIWANDAGGGNIALLTIDQELVIPPLDGVLHTVQAGDTIASLAATYGVEAALIAWFPGNELTGVDAPLTVGQRIMVPGGRKPVAALPPAPAAPAARGGASYFGWPTTGTITTLYSWYHGGIDIAATTNTPIFAAQSGEVIFMGWDTRGYGYTIVLDHHNGWYTRYAHLSGMYPQEGDWVNRGDLIALMGSTGRSTGPHLHFEILTNGYRYDPLDYLPR